LRRHEDGGRVDFEGRDAVRITYDRLPATEANSALADLLKQHPGAAVDTDPQHYQDATGRLAPKG
jgi:hypothetical protein